MVMLDAQISVIAYRTASVLATLLDTVPGAAQRMQDQFLEELKYVILEQRVSSGLADHLSVRHYNADYLLLYSINKRGVCTVASLNVTPIAASYCPLVQSMYCTWNE